MSSREEEVGLGLGLGLGSGLGLGLGLGLALSPNPNPIPNQEFQQMKLSASGQELGGDLLFGRRLGFSGAPSALSP